MRELLTRLLHSFRRRQSDDRIAEETAFHLDMLEAEYRAKGLGPSQARDAARREFGGLTQMQDQFRDQASLPWLDALLRDLAFALRSFSKTPGTTALIVMTLALGIGANTAVFSLLHELLLRPLPFENAGRLVTVGRRWPEGVGAVTPKEFVLIRDHAKSFEAVGLRFMYKGENVETPGMARHEKALRVSDGYFGVRSAQAFLGRTFLAEEDVPHGPNVAILSFAFWQEAFQGDAAMLGRAIRIGGVPHTVIGVMPADYDPADQARLWLPLQNAGTGNDNNYGMSARLRPEVTAEQASAEVDALFREQLDRGRVQRLPAAVVSMREDQASEFRQPILLLYGGVCIVLLVACLNVANLLVARSAAREKEIAVRAAIGAGRGRIVRQVLTESVLLSAFGCLAGLAIGKLFLWVLTSLIPYREFQHVELSRFALLWTIGISFAAGVAFGLAPVRHSIRLRLADALKVASGRASAARSALRMRQILVVSQVSLSTILLAMAGLLIHTILNLRAVDLGFDPRGVMTAPMTLNADKLADKDSLLTYYRQAVDRVRQVPGIKSVAITTQLPVQGQFNLPFELLDSPSLRGPRGMQARIQTVDTFRTLGMRIVRGRDFELSDQTSSSPVAVVNEAFAKRYFAGREVLGQRFTAKPLGTPDVWSIVGVVNDVHETGIRSAAPPVIYLLMDQAPLRMLQIVHSFIPAKWVMRMQPGAGMNAAAEVRRAAGSLDATQPFQEFVWMDTIVSATMNIERFLGMLLGAFGLLTLIMVASGLYGTLAYSVEQRRLEIGVRVALGAVASDVAGMIVGSALKQVGMGLALGLAGSYAASKALRSLLFQIEPLDVASLVAAAGALLLVGAIAAAGPSLMAVRTDPIRSLRTE